MAATPLAHHIAIVDDDPDILQVLTDALALEGYRVTPLQTGQALLDLLESDPADLILLDPLAPNLRPVIDGFGVVAHSASAGNVTDVVVQGNTFHDMRGTAVSVHGSRYSRVVENLF